MTEPLMIGRDGNVARIQMDDGRANALGTRMLTALRRAFTQVEDADAVLLLGRPKIFCGGLDLAEVVPMAAPDLAAFLDLFHETMRVVLALPRPLIIAAAGSAVAGGAVLLCGGDLRLGARDAGMVGVNEVRLGIPFPVSALELVRAGLPTQEAARALLFGELVGKEDALRRGYLHALVEPEQLAAAAEERARDAAMLPGEATGPVKRALRAEALQRVDAQRAASTEAFAAAWAGSVAQERLRKVLDGLKGRR